MPKRRGVFLCMWLIFSTSSLFYTMGNDSIVNLENEQLRKALIAGITQYQQVAKEKTFLVEGNSVEIGSLVEQRTPKASIRYGGSRNEASAQINLVVGLFRFFLS